VLAERLRVLRGMVVAFSLLASRAAKDCSAGPGPAAACCQGRVRVPRPRAALGQEKDLRIVKHCLAPRPVLGVLKNNKRKEKIMNTKKKSATEDTKDTEKVKNKKAKVRTCRVCGCTDTTPCIVDGEPCSWVEGINEDLCSACEKKLLKN